MRRSQFLKKLDAALVAARLERSTFASRGGLAGALAGEGYVGGYIDALSDVAAVLTHGHPADHRGFWNADLQKELAAPEQSL